MHWKEGHERRRNPFLGTQLGTERYPDHGVVTMDLPHLFFHWQHMDFANHLDRCASIWDQKIDSVHCNKGCIQPGRIPGLHLFISSCTSEADWLWFVKLVNLPPVVMLPLENLTRTYHWTIRDVWDEDIWLCLHLNTAAVFRGSFWILAFTVPLPRCVLAIWMRGSVLSLLTISTITCTQTIRHDHSQTWKQNHSQW